jgi:DNA-binding PadR family transcriptional regulator
MYPDNSLTPKEATRLCGLGILMGGERDYADLAHAIRSHVTAVTGPSLEMMGTSIELLRYEGLVTAREQDGRNLIAVSDKGREEFRTLMLANLRDTDSEFSRLVISLKFRFLRLLDRPERQAQIDLLSNRTESDLDRLVSLREAFSEEGRFFTDWVDTEISLAEQRLAWLESLRADLG